MRFSICAWFIRASLGLSLLSTCAAADQVSIEVPNFSFESPAESSGASSDNSVPGWQASAGAGLFLNNAYGVRNPASGVSPSNGSQVAYINTNNSNNGGNGIVLYTANLAVSTDINQIFTLTVDAGATNSGKYVELVLYVNSGYVGGTGYNLTSTVLVPKTHSYTSTAVGQAFSIGIFTANSVSGEAYFDNVRLEGPAGTSLAPEPSGLSLLAGFVLIARRRTRRSNSCPIH